MDTILLLALAYILLFLYSFIKSKNVLLTPQLIFLVGFILQAVYAFPYIDRYEIHLSNATLFVLLCGACLFVLTASFAQKNGGIVLRKYRLIKTHSTPTAFCDNWKLIICLMIQAAAIYLTICHLKTLYTGSLKEMMYAYRSAALGYNNKYSYISTSLPIVVRALRRASFASGFIWGYLISYSLVYKVKKGRMLLIANLALAALCDILLGGRKGTVQIAVSMAVVFYYLYGNKKGWKKTTNIKTAVIGVAICVVCLSVFSYSAQLVGRNVSKTSTDYLSAYLAAPLKNLDIYITEGNNVNNQTNYITLPGFISFFNDYLKIGNMNADFTYPYNRVNGINIGNAYTTYYAFLFDHGISGIFIFIPIMAWISGALFTRTIRADDRELDLSVVLYSYVIFGVFLAFFDNSFYINLVSVKMAEYFFVWLILKWFIVKEFRWGHELLYSNLLLRDALTDQRKCESGKYE